MKTKLETMSHTNIIRSNLSESKAKWFGVYCKFKCEKQIVQHLTQKGVEAYVPLLSETKHYTRKTKLVQKPLFTCYVFVKITKAEYVKVLQTDHVMQFVKINKELISIPDDEINMLKRIVGEIKEIDLEQHLDPGTPVEIISGNLTGIKGTLIESLSDKNFLVELDHIGFNLRMNIPRSFLRSRAKKTMSTI
jgi:transcription antitermination factor NusG